LTPDLAGAPHEPAEITVIFDDNRRASMVFGLYDKHLAHIERQLGVSATANGNYVVLQSLYERSRLVPDLRIGDVEGAIQETAMQGNLFPAPPEEPEPDAPAPPPRSKVKLTEPDRGSFEQIITRKKGPVKARNAAQHAYLRALRRHEMVFAEGPAGTGKTWLAVGHAVQLMEQGVVERLILSRPAVEAGERLGFLPGDMKDKVDPYLRPIYDALYDFMDARNVERCLETQKIEVAPLAFMRGRTLTNAMILLDEAQNATSMQMKMFLTRLGENSRMVVTGDPTQIDLPSGQRSGLVEAIGVLKDVDGIGHVRFAHGDVVRHELVKRIVRAYEETGRTMGPQ
jgi:phosphate starvation-inducible PhoH-like protein